MKIFAAIVAILGVCAASGLAGESSPKINKTKFYRPHYNARKGARIKPRALNSAVIVNAASYEDGVSPGGLATIFGSILGPGPGVVYAGTNPLPKDLDEVEVDVSGVPAPIYGIAFANGSDQDQISIQVPYGAPTGPNAAEIQVYDQGFLVADFFADSFTEDPGLFVYDGDFAIAQASDYSLIGPDNPAIPGEPLVLYVTGLGPLDQDLVDGYGAPAQEPFATTVDPFTVVVDNEVCDVFFSGLSPGFVGLYQVNFYVPKDAAAGDLQISIQSAYANSAIATLPVR